MAKYVIDATAHVRLRAFVSGKGYNPSAAVELGLGDNEARTLLRKAKLYGFEDAIVQVDATPPALPPKPASEPVDGIAQVTLPDSPPRRKSKFTPEEP